MKKKVEIGNLLIDVAGNLKQIDSTSIIIGINDELNAWIVKKNSSLTRKEIHDLKINKIRK